jgi:hypothetical protein
MCDLKTVVVCFWRPILNKSGLSVNKMNGILAAALLMTVS